MGKDKKAWGFSVGKYRVTSEETEERGWSVRVESGGHVFHESDQHGSRMKARNHGRRIAQGLVKKERKTNKEAA